MSSWIKKVEYTCHCGQDYGSCEGTGKFFIKYFGVSDTYVLLHQPHPSDGMLILGYFDDDSLKALGALLTVNFDSLSDCTSEEWENIKSVV